MNLLLLFLLSLIVATCGRWGILLLLVFPWILAFRFDGKQAFLASQIVLLFIAFLFTVGFHFDILKNQALILALILFIFLKIRYLYDARFKFIGVNARKSCTSLLIIRAQYNRTLLNTSPPNLQYFESDYYRLLSREANSNYRHNLGVDSIYPRSYGGPVQWDS